MTYIGSLCFVIQACTTASRAIIVCEIESNWSFIYMMTLSRGWVVYYMLSTPENSRGRSFNADNHEQQVQMLSKKPAFDRGQQHRLLLAPLARKAPGPNLRPAKLRSSGLNVPPPPPSLSYGGRA